MLTCMPKSGLNLSSEKCVIGTQKIKFLGNVVTPEGIAPEKTKIDKFLRTQMPKTIKQVRRLIGSAKFFRNYMSKFGRKLLPYYLKKDGELAITEEHRKFSKN